MKVGWKKNKNLEPQYILDKIESCQSLSEDGEVSYNAIEFQNAFAALLSMIVFPKKIVNELDIDKLVREGLSETAKESNNLNKKDVMQNINNFAIFKLATKEDKYLFLTSLSISGDLPFKRLQIESSTIRFIGDKYPKKYSSRNKLINSNQQRLINKQNEYTKIIVSVKSKSKSGAVSKALRSIDMMRAILSFYSNFTDEFLADQNTAVNRIRLGEIHTLHKANGAIAIERLWFEPGFVKGSIFKSRNYKKLAKKYYWFIDNLEKCKYNNILKEALLQYVRSLDEKDNNTALLRLWGAIESLALESNSSNSDAIPRRYSFLFKEHEYHKQIIEHLRERRNKSVHAGEQFKKAKILCYQAQFYFRKMVLFHLHNVDIFDSFDQANEFLDLPKDTELFNRKEMIEKALIYRRLVPNSDN